MTLNISIRFSQNYAAAVDGCPPLIFSRNMAADTRLTDVETADIANSGINNPDSANHAHRPSDLPERATLLADDDQGTVQLRELVGWSRLQF